ncbi:unnamed protein product, partial [Prorocentrum cordatum]
MFKFELGDEAAAAPAASATGNVRVYEDATSPAEVRRRAAERRWRVHSSKAAADDRAIKVQLGNVEDKLELPGQWSQAIYDVVGEDYDSQEALGRKASQAILRLASRASRHEFPFGMGVLAQLCACTNGAFAAIFPGGPCPAALPVLSINQPQTRKSSGHRAGMAIGRQIDENVVDKAKRLARDLAAEHLDQQGVEAAARAVWRCAGDLDRVKPNELHDLSGRVYFRTLVNLDEAYRFLKMVPSGFKRWKWPKLLKGVVGLLGLPEAAADYEEARREMQPVAARATQEDSGPEEDGPGEFLPNRRGYA